MNSNEQVIHFTYIKCEVEGDPIKIDNNENKKYDICYKEKRKKECDQLHFNRNVSQAINRIQI